LFVWIDWIERELTKTNTLMEDLTDLKRFDRIDGVTDETHCLWLWFWVLLLLILLLLLSAATSLFVLLSEWLFSLRFLFRRLTNTKSQNTKQRPIFYNKLTFFIFISFTIFYFFKKFIITRFSIYIYILKFVLPKKIKHLVLR
jgi:hypothetical protein